MCGKHGPCGPVTRAPAFAGVTLVGVFERPILPDVMPASHTLLRPERVEGRPRRSWFDGLTTEKRCTCPLGFTPRSALSSSKGGRAGRGSTGSPRRTGPNVRQAWPVRPGNLGPRLAAFRLAGDRL